MYCSNYENTGALLGFGEAGSGRGGLKRKKGAAWDAIVVGGWERVLISQIRRM